MAHRRGQKGKKQEEERRRQEELRQALKQKRIKRVLVVTIVLSLSVLGLYYAATRAPPYDWTQCFGASAGPQQQHIHFGLYIQIGEKRGELNVSFIRLPEQLGVTYRNGVETCAWPMHTHTERNTKYTVVHVEAPNTHAYTLQEFFIGWSEWQSYPASIYFSPDGVSYYRTQNFEMNVLRPDGQGNVGNPVRSYAYGSYVPKDNDYIELIVHEPYQVVPGPYPGGELPIEADWSYTPVQGQFRTIAFAASANGGVAPYEFEWDFADGTLGEGATTVHTFPRSGEFLVILYVTDANGLTVRIEHIVQVA